MNVIVTLNNYQTLIERSQDYLYRTYKLSVEVTQLNWEYEDNEYTIVVTARDEEEIYIKLQDLEDYLEECLGDPWQEIFDEMDVGI